MFRNSILAAAAVLVFGTATAQESHQHHHHHGALPDMDAEGKRLTSYQVKHDMDQETLAALREKIALYRGMTDMEVMVLADEDFDGDTLLTMPGKRIRITKDVRGGEEFVEVEAEQ